MTDRRGNTTIADKKMPKTHSNSTVLTRQPLISMFAYRVKDGLQVEITSPRTVLGLDEEFRQRLHVEPDNIGDRSYRRRYLLIHGTVAANA
ncbi:MAG: hypothetical protein ACLTS1_14470 [Coprococcus sp.]